MMTFDGDHDDMGGDDAAMPAAPEGGDDAGMGGDDAGMGGDDAGMGGDDAGSEGAM